MGWTAWLLSALFLLVGQFARANASQKCHTEESILRKALIGYTFLTIAAKKPYECYQACAADVRCQSFNYVILTETCELNNRTKEARPGNFVTDRERFYVKRWPGRVPLGSVKELPAYSCREIMASEGYKPITESYWLQLNASGNSLVHAHCGMPSPGNNRRLGVIQKFLVPNTTRYTVRAYGARGGTHSFGYGFNPGIYYGGKGARMEGTFNLAQGTELSVVVGKKGGNSVEVKGGQKTTKSAAELGLSVEDNAGTGGGGGSFVYTSSNYLLIAAGGGGGGSGGFTGVDGQSGTSGTQSIGRYSSDAGFKGSLGRAGVCNTFNSGWHGGVGAGWLGKGCTRDGYQDGQTGGSRSENWAGGLAGAMNSGNNGGPFPGAVGGFGGGGGGSEDNGASGGGGGYSGGGSGKRRHQAGGGGGSFCSGEACSGVTGGNMHDDGMVEIIETP